MRSVKTIRKTAITIIEAQEGLLGNIFFIHRHSRRRSKLSTRQPNQEHPVTLVQLRQGRFLSGL
jgi:hypothetical protein